MPASLMTSTKGRPGSTSWGAPLIVISTVVLATIRRPRSCFSGCSGA